ncbi:pilus assembly protein N-terminal domain-containing protein [Dysgonomonas sp. ZJ279]|uniref:pilus assembly protein N-terminal domain-containing protein n=1 Tax=Dysgonomonas sp. ZJ279 TaxID=2709796 RepID=UPI0013E9E093|nr:pilus assembly protein N-terminal domain-containing protein [Dysgonomonas sp. ZJ279]
MKRTKFSLFLLLTFSLCLSFSSCNDDDDMFFYSLSSTITNFIEVTETQIPSFGSTSVGVRFAQGGFTVKSDNDAVATVEQKKENLVVITAHSEGTTTIIATDSNNRTARLTVTVKDNTLSMLVTQQSSNVEAENPTDDNKFTIAKIKADIISQLVPVGGGFSLAYTSSTGGTLLYFEDVKDLTKKVEGTFELGYDDNLKKVLLILKYNDNSYTYTMSAPYDLQSTTATVLELEMNFINDYKTMINPKINIATGTLTTSVKTGSGF